MNGYTKSYYGEQNAATKIVTPKKHGKRLTYRQELDQFILKLPKGASILDVGCGEGRALARIREMRPDLHLYGIDHSEVNSFLPEGTIFTQGSVEELGQLYKPNTFDAVICQHVIEHLVFPMPLISGMYGVLRSGGKVFIETPNWTRLLVPFSFLYFWNDYSHIHPYTSFAMNRLFLEHGFSMETTRTVSSCDWRIPKMMRKSQSKIHSTTTEVSYAPSAFAHTHNRRSFFAKAAAYAINPLLRDLLIAVAIKE